MLNIALSSYTVYLKSNQNRNYYFLHYQTGATFIELFWRKNAQNLILKINAFKRFSIC